MPSRIVLAVVVSSGCFLDKDDDPPPPPPDAAVVPAGCIPHDVRERQTVNVSGQVLDFATAAPVRGATVEITTAWDVTQSWPHPECPLLATLTTDATGRFGPVSLQAGSHVRPPFIMFLVSGAGRAQTASDNRACSEDTCNLGHTIGAPTAELVSTWRGDLAAGGMTDAASRGLVAFRYKNNDGSNAGGVTPSLGVGVVRDLVPGTEVRFLDADRRTMMPVAQATTSPSGMALVGIAGSDKTISLGGRRMMQQWAGTGCLLEPGWVFLEDKSGSP